MKKKNPSYESEKRYRHEYKYLLNPMQEGILRVKAMGIMERDPHVGLDGSYLIRSLYFDDFADSCLYANLSGADPRSKFRIRYYNCDLKRIVLEKKSKIQGVGCKESCSLTVSECKRFLRGEIPEVVDEMPEMKKKLLNELRLRRLFPKVIVTYERIPFIYAGGNVRVTFDRNITSSSDITSFLRGDYRERPVLPCGQSLLEVKWDELLPRHIKETLQTDQLNWTAFSKYFMCRMYHL